MRVNRSVLGFGLAALAAMAAMSLPLPWPALGLAAIVVALVIAIRGIALARRTPLSSGAVMYMGLGLGLLAMFTLYSIPLIATWQDQWAYQECLQMTQTIQGQDSCRATFEKATEIDWRKLLQGGGD
jgi:ABC-type transport system involved in cytochrome c biogenesis permease subunit